MQQTGAFGYWLFAGHASHVSTITSLARHVPRRSRLKRGHGCTICRSEKILDFFISFIIYLLVIIFYLVELKVSKDTVDY